MNHTSVYNVRTEGDSVFLQFNNSTLNSDFLYFNYLGIRTVANETDLNYQATSWLGVYAGYHYSNRRIRSVEEFAFPQGTPTSRPLSRPINFTPAFSGFRLRPVKPLTITFDGEIGRADRPFTPVADANYHALGARVQYRLKISAVLGLHARQLQRQFRVALELQFACPHLFARRFLVPPRLGFASTRGIPRFI